VSIKPILLLKLRLATNIRKVTNAKNIPGLVGNINTLRQLIVRGKGSTFRCNIKFGNSFLATLLENGWRLWDSGFMQYIG
jgi:hypothetical protein